MRKRFFVSGLRDAPKAYIDALQAAGYEMVDWLYAADFVLVDKEPTLPEKREKWRRLTLRKPVFVFPHTPYAYWFWDGYLEPPKAACTFVVGEGAKMGMQAYGYPGRVEVVGFSRCEVKPFQPTKGKNLLYASAHLLGQHQWPHKGDRDVHLATTRWIVENRKAFDKVTVNYSYSLKENDMEEFVGCDLTFFQLGLSKNLSARTAMDQFYGADLVISCDTFGYLALACGIPTILVGHNDRYEQHSSRWICNHYELYKSHYEFPLFLEDMTAKEVLALRRKPNSLVEEWKKLNIGESFDAEKFLSVVKEYV